MNGRRLLSVLLVLVLFSVAANAQVVKASIGVTGGGVASMMSDSKSSSLGSAYLNGYGGAFLTMKFGRVIGLRGGVNYLMQGSEYELSGKEMTAEQTYMNIPFTLLLNVKSGLSLECGFYRNVLVKSALIEHGGREIATDYDNNVQPSNFGAVAGLTFNMGRYVFLSFKYHHGLTDSYMINKKGCSYDFATVGLGFNVINTRKKAFK